MTLDPGHNPGHDPGHMTAAVRVRPPAVQDLGGLTLPLTKIVLLLRNVVGADPGHVTAAVRV